MELTRIIGLTITAICIMALVIATVSSKDLLGTPGPGGKNKVPQGADPNQKECQVIGVRIMGCKVLGI